MLEIRTMTADDLPLGMRLKEQAGWNQTLADWRRILAIQPGGCFVAHLDGRPVGTTTTCVFGTIAWIAMVLVDEAVRGQGVGRQLMQHALAYLDALPVRTVRLDATPLGRPLYERLGFVAEYELSRWEGTANFAGQPPPRVEAAADSQLAAICALDRQVTGTDRRRLIERLYQQRPEAMQVVFADGLLAGYSSLRLGTRATQIGPIVALDAAAGRLLAEAALERCAGQPIFLDIPLANCPAAQWAQAQGLRIQRPLARMRRGAAVDDRPESLWASFGPEKG